MKKTGQVFLRRRRFLMMLPILALPFVTMIFWALGGGQAAPAQATSLNTGLNLNLPDAHFLKDDPENKLRIYEQARRDSLKSREARENDPYFDLAMLSPDSASDLTSLLADGPRVRVFENSTPTQLSIEETEKRVNDRLEQLTQELSKAEQPAPRKEVSRPNGPIHSKQFSNDIDRLESMMEMMNKGEQSDPEMQELSGVLDKILDIQNPARVRERIKEESTFNKDQVYAVATIDVSDGVNFFGTARSADTIATNAFFDLSEESDPETTNMIPVVVHDTQDLISGSTVKLRLLADIYINGHLIPKDEFVFGICELGAERLAISVNSIRSKESLFPVNLTAFDLDGVEGLFIPGAIARDGAKQSTDQIMQGMQIMTLDPSIGAQAAAAGLQAAKGFLGRKVKAVRVTVKSGYKVLLKDSNVH
jgi:conjugative transposon TraM protein